MIGRFDDRFFTCLCYVNSEISHFLDMIVYLKIMDATHCDMCIGLAAVKTFFPQ